MKDHLGNDALDYGDIRELKEKYTDNSFVFITEKMIGDNMGYVLHIADHHDKTWAWKCEFIKKMESSGKGHKTFVSVRDGNKYWENRMEGFMGGIFL